MVEPQRSLEIEQNFQAFQLLVHSQLPHNQGKFALMRHGGVDEVFAALIDAVVAGHSRFPDGMFSIQEVTTTSLDLGFYSHASPERRVP